MGRARLHVWHSFLSHMEIAVKIGLQRGVEMLFREVGEIGRMYLEGGVVDQHVEAAEFLHRACHRAAAKGAGADIAPQRETAPALCLDGALRRLGVAILAEIGDGDIGALAREQHRHSAADAGIAAGDQGHLAVELLRALPERRVIERRRLDRPFLAGLRMMLLRERRHGIFARTSLHGAGGLRLSLAAVIRVDLALHAPLLLLSLRRI